MIRSALMTIMTNAAIKAGRGLKRDYGEVEQLQVSLKGPGDFVSLADKRSEKTIFEELSKARPGYGFVMEEGGRVEGSDKSHTWHIDPLDATTNFLHAIPIFAISIALEREGQIVAGVVYNPATDETYVAEKGQGAFGGARRMRVAARRDLSEALIGCGIPHLGKMAEHPAFQADLAAVMARCLAREPTARYRSAGELKQALVDVLKESGVEHISEEVEQRLLPGVEPGV